MVIYAEYLFLENFVTGLLLLQMTARLTGQRPQAMRMAAGGLLSGGAAFTIFLPLSGIAAVLMRLAAAAVITFVALGAHRLQELLKKTTVFFALTFLAGGAAMALLLWQQIPAVSGNGSLYTGGLTYTVLVVLGLAVFGIGSIFIRILRGERIRQAVEGVLEVELQGQIYRFSAMVDTGNALREPISGCPVMLLDRKGAASLPPPEHLRQVYTVIPYQAVGTSRGMLEGYRCENSVFLGKQMGPVVLGLYDGDLGAVEAIVNREVMNCEICESGKESVLA